MPAKDKMLFACELHNVLSESMLKIQNAVQISVVALHRHIFFLDESSASLQI